MIVLLLNALEDTDYEPLYIQLLTCFQDKLHTPTQKSVYDVIMFAGYKHKWKSTEQANVVKNQKEPTKGKKTCLNPNCKAPRQHSTQDCWFKGGGSVHKAPDWWKELQVKRKCKNDHTVKANIAEESKTTSEMANLTAEHLIDHLKDRYKSYICIYAGKNIESAAEVWSGVWNEQTTTLPHIRYQKQEGNKHVQPLAHHIHTALTLDA